MRVDVSKGENRWWWGGGETMEKEEARKEGVETKGAKKVRSRRVSQRRRTKTEMGEGR